MFYGSVPAEAQAIMNKIVKMWDVSDIYIGCSGNFTLEKFICPMGRFNLHSNDVTLYSLILGQFFQGETVELSLSETGAEMFPWLTQYMRTDVDRIATLLLMSRIVAYVGKEDHPYYGMMLQENIKQYPVMHEKTVKKLTDSKLRISSYYNGDAVDFVKKAPDDAGFVSFPPNKNTGKVLAKDFSKLEQIFTFEPLVYGYFDDEESLVEYFRLIMQKKAWCFGTDMRLPADEFGEYLKGMTKKTNRGASIYLYANYGRPQIVTPSQSAVSANIKKLGKGMEIGDNIKLYDLSNDAFEALRSQYLNVNICPGSATKAIGVLVDDYLIGVYAFSAAPTLSNWDKHIETPTIYLMSDFPVAPVDYKNLAKLVLYAALSKESKRLAERITRRRCASLVTTAFSPKPESMKYRGLFKVLNRTRTDSLDHTGDGAPANHTQPYKINYGAPMGQWTLREGLQMWKKKSSQKR